ncbi:MAG TPA: xanthine dehydrogenase family protein molybdopterin-binding subunit [Thermoleophilaceae bacterium]|nr:xanthine dehydrogenase family protein molybdopterin-binding subunit [Thermoleophilaceae bacterium]
MAAQETPTVEEVRTGAWSGQSIPRKEDRRLLQGQGAFIDDLWVHRAAHVHFVRSPYGHARIRGVDVSRAEAIPGVYATLTPDEVVELQEPYLQLAPPPGGNLRDYCLAVGKARFMGEPVAAVLAESREVARDAAELVEVDYEPLPAVVDGPTAAEPGAPVLHEEVGSNVVWQGTYDWGDVDWALESADHVLRIDRLHFQRFSASPLECNAALVSWDPGTGVFEIRSNCQMPQFAAMFMGPAIGVPTDRMHFITHDIGGGFGVKITSYPYLTALALLSRKARRPAKWTEYRSEHLMASGHSNERTFLDIEVPVLKDGTILGFAARAVDDAGAYTRYEPLGSVIWSQVVPGCYRLKHVRLDFTQVVTNKCPVSPVRGYSRMQHLWFVERLVDTVATKLGFDPAELRKANYVRPGDYPYETPNGCVYDSGDLPQELDKALGLIDYETARRRKEAARGSGKRIGIGIGSTLDSGTNNFGQARIINPELPFSGNGEAAIVKLDLYGEVVVALGTVPQGQSHETTAAQVVADILAVTPDEVSVHVGSNTARNAYVGFSGTYASQFAVTGLGAAMGAAMELKNQIVKVAAAALEASEDEIELEGGAACVRGDPERQIPFMGVAGLVYSNNAALPPEVADAVGLTCRHVYRPPFQVPDPERKHGNLTLTYASQVHACVVEVDERTGQVTIVDYGAVDECGRRINPLIVEGQVHGATAHGIGAALHESLEYDGEGRLLAPNFYDFHAVTALDLPDIKTDHVECPSPFTPNGAKGMGEGGGAPLQALSSAIQDAVADTGAVVFDTHNPPERVWRLLRDPSSGAKVEVISR